MMDWRGRGLDALRRVSLVRRTGAERDLRLLIVVFVNCIIDIGRVGRRSSPSV